MDNRENLQLRERDVIPTREVLEQVLADSFGAYEIFQNELANLDIEQDWQWYTPHKAWYAKGQYFWTSVRGARKEKVLYWLYVHDGYFSVAVWFKEKNRTQVLNCDVSENVKQIIRNAKAEMGLPTFPILIEVTTTAQLTDIYTLLDCKKKLESI